MSDEAIRVQPFAWGINVEASSQEKSQITHYIPEWILRKFRDPSLFELDIFTGKTNVRAPKKAGSNPDLWSNDAEDLLSVHDNAAAQIYRAKISGHERIILTEAERQAFALWLAHFFVRSPKRLAKVAELREEEDQDREGMVDDLYRDRNASLERIRRENPEPFAIVIEAFGREEAEERILAHYANYIRTAPIEKFGTAKEIREQIIKSLSPDRYSNILLRYEWTWLSTHHGFVIGDDPVVPWHLMKCRWEYGIAQEGVEITMPLSSQLCICLQQQHVKKNTHLHPISRSETRILNCRQRLSAHKYVYGNSPAALDFIKAPILGWPQN